MEIKKWWRNHWDEVMVIIGTLISIIIIVSAVS